MLIEIILFLFMGIFFGIFTGLIPGIHINLIGVLLISLSISLFSSVNPIYFVVFITSMAITHTFLDFIPSIFLGCPDTDTELSILPGHDLLKQGKGYEAILLTAYGSLAAIFALILFSFPVTMIIKNTYSYLESIIPYLLIFVSFILIITEKNKFKALFVFLLTGLLGLSILNLGFREPILPLLTGLFGGSMLLISIKNKIEIPRQIISNEKINLKKPLIGALTISPICSLLPGLGSGQAAVLGNMISKSDKKGFLVLLGATNTLVMGFSFISLYAISRTRTGAALAINQILGFFSWKILILILIIVLISGLISFFLTKFIAKFLSEKIEKINYTILSLMTLIILIVVVFLISDFFGLIVLIITTLTGIYCISLDVRRTNMMGCLLIPTILFYLL